MAAAAPKQGGNKLLLSLGLATAGGVGYYLYSAGGDPKVAEKKFEHDLSKFSTSAKDSLPGREREAKTAVKLHAQEAGAKIDEALDKARSATQQFDKKVEAYRVDAEKKIDSGLAHARDTASSTIDKFDRSVEKGAAQSKSWLGSWFGGK